MLNKPFEIQKTADGSATILSANFGETYHSVNGAITESKHVFIETCFKQINKNPVHILEIGFGTGLNAFLSFIEAEKEKKVIVYSAIEKYPVPPDIYNNLYYPEISIQGENKDFLFLHQSEWDKEIKVSEYFHFTKINGDILSHDYGLDKFDGVFFDAFSPNVQPELWTKEIFIKLYQAMKKGGILSTYCAKGEVRRNMQSAGFSVERLPGPPGKREILRAVRE